MMGEDMLAQLQELAALPQDTPWGLPGSFYTSPEFFAWEKQTVLRDGWHCLGRMDEVPNIGDFYTLTLLDEPLIVVRDTPDTVQVLSNVCRHRGMPVALGAGNAKRFVCTYHAWTYDLDGHLLRAARMKNAGFDAEKCGLPQINSMVWNGFIYATLSDSPAPLADTLAELNTLIAPYEPENYRLVHQAGEVWQTNWKSLVENFMEGYHLSVVHPQTLHGYTPTGLSKKGPSGAGFTSYLANYPDQADGRGQGADGLSDAQRRRSTLFAAFPTQVCSVAASLLVSLSLFPLAADQVLVRWTLSGYGDDLDAETLENRVALWNEVNREDREKLELMQAALSSRHAIGGPLAGDDYEGTVRDFQIWLASHAKLTA
jgi:phenylpropionate dioxygenase-like ring-hydroxylating dioxygenase large terminal subunit